MLRQERLRRAIQEAAENDRSAFSGKPYSVTADPKLRFLFEDPRPEHPSPRLMIALSIRATSFAPEVPSWRRASSPRSGKPLTAWPS